MTSDATCGTTPNDDRRWTVLVYMAAQSVPGEAVPLLNEAEADIAEMTKVGSTDRLNIFFQLHNGGIPQRGHIGYGTREPVHESERDVTNGKALAAFITWALKEAKHRQQDHSLLVLWGHAYRFGIAPMPTAEGIDAIDFAELAAVLRRCQSEFQRHYGSSKPPKLDMVGFDACDLATVEIACQLKEFADFILASQIGIPLPGWPYNRVLDRLAVPKGRLMGPAEFGTYVVRRFCESYAAEERPVSLTLLDLRRADELFELTERLARQLAIAMDASLSELTLISALFCRSQTIDGKPFVDVADLCLNLVRYSGNVQVRAAAESLGNFLISPAPVVPGTSVEGIGRPFVAEHGRNACKTARLQGVSLYAPHVALDTHDWLSACTWYEKLVFARQTLWNELVRALAQPT